MPSYLKFMGDFISSGQEFDAQQEKINTMGAVALGEQN
jgi:hypothetical protein